MSRPYELSHEYYSGKRKTVIIKYDIQKKYIQPEIHVCSDVKNLKTVEIFDTISQIYELKIRGYDEKKQESVMINSTDIIRIFCASKSVFASTDSGTYKIWERLYEIENKLGTGRFVRISNSEIVNIRKIKSLNTSLTGTIKMQLQGDIETYVSRRYVTKIKQTLGL